MNRQEFSKLLVDTRKEANCGMNEIGRRTGMMFSQIQRIETCYNNYSVVNVVKYLNALGRKLQLKCGRKAIVVADYKDIPEFFQQVRESKGVSQYRLAQIIGRSITNVINMENQITALHIDSFLAIILGLKIDMKIILDVTPKK